jgi:hypothetical protein
MPATNCWHVTHDLEANGFFSDLLISEVFFRQRWDQLEEKRRQLSRDLAHHQHVEGAYMELGTSSSN